MHLGLASRDETVAMRFLTLCHPGRHGKQHSSVAFTHLAEQMPKFNEEFLFLRGFAERFLFACGSYNMRHRARLFIRADEQLICRDLKRPR